MVRDYQKKSQENEPSTLLVLKKHKSFWLLQGSVDVNYSYVQASRLRCSLDCNLESSLLSWWKNVFSGLVRSVSLGLSLLHRPHNARECLPEEHWQKHTMCQRDLNWQTSLPPGKQNLQVQSSWSQESNRKLMRASTIQKPCDAALQVKFKTNNKVFTSWMLFLDVQKRFFPSFLYTQVKNTHSFLSTDSVVA